MTENGEKTQRRSVLCEEMRVYYREGFLRPLFARLDIGELDELEFLADFCQGILSAAPEYADALELLADVHKRREEYGEGAKLLHRLAALRPEDPAAHYNLACFLALDGRSDEAFAALEAAVRAGYRDVKHLANDEDLQALREDRRFAALLRKLRRRRE